jgi:lipopolysaccharide transport system ATP-binding protein
MSDEVLIKAEHVSKKFCRSLKRSLWYGLQDMASEVAGASDRHHSLRKDEFWAVDNVSFELRRGECLGLIGHNGAGKTTLLKMLNGLLKPDHGRIEMRGRVGALIALGAGFNPILTGRENIYVSASVLGLSKREIDVRLDEIIDFAGIGDFIDSPVQSYSSGMQVRLGFAVATTVSPDILILDEVLAVGDAAFRAKCYTRIGKLQRDAAVIFVSHSMQQVSQICSLVLSLCKGEQRYFGSAKHGVSQYMAESSDAGAESVWLIQHPVHSASISFKPHLLAHGDVLHARCDFELDSPLLDCSLRIPVYNHAGLVVAEWNSRRLGITFNLDHGKNHLEIAIGPLQLGPGTFYLGVAITDSTGVYLPVWSLRNHSFQVCDGYVGACDYQLTHERILLNDAHLSIPEKPRTPGSATTCG